MLDQSLIRSLPKAELHVHLDGSLRPGTMVELAREQGIALPSFDTDELGEYMVARDATDLESYLERFRLTLSVMQTAGGLERISRELSEDAAADGLRYMEVRFAPLLNTEGGLTNREVLEAVARGLADGERDHGVRWGIIVCALRSLSPEASLEMARAAVDAQDLGVVGFDLAGGERGHPPAVHLEAFRLAADANLGVTIHAGEGAGPESIAEALHSCGARRIGHGTRLREDPDLMEYVRDFQVPLEMCPTSNVQTRVAKSLADHPVGSYLDEGIPVSVNTDNRLISGTDLTDEITRTAAAQGWGRDQLREVILNGFRGAFLPWPAKQEAVRSAEEELERHLG